MSNKPNEKQPHYLGGWHYNRESPDAVSLMETLIQWPLISALKGMVDIWFGVSGEFLML